MRNTAWLAAIAICITMQSCMLLIVGEGKSPKRIMEDHNNLINVEKSGEISCVDVKKDGTYTIDKSGCVGRGYRATYDAALSCRDLTDQEIDDATNAPGNAYDDGKWTGANPLLIPYTSFEVFEANDGTIFIIEDDGSVLQCERVT